MHVILTQAVGGANAVKEIADTLRALRVRASETVRRDASAGGIELSMPPLQAADDESKYDTLITTPVCVLVPKLDSVLMNLEDAEEIIEKMRQEVAGRVCVRKSQVHVYWNDNECERVGGSPRNDKHLQDRGINSVRKFLFDQMMEQLPQLGGHEAEVKAQLK
ncbi:hypothetical protein HK405_011955, partial [Cladochytrium tenue]